MRTFYAVDIRFHSHINQNDKRKEGYALSIALALMGFMLLVVMGLASLVHVETTNATTTRHRLLAKLSAQLGVQIALGELQRWAGRDGQITAPATLLENVPDTNGPSGDGLNEGSFFWTGVWESSDLPKHFSNETSAIMTPTQKQDNALAWLVSGGAKKGGAGAKPRDAISDPVNLGQLSYETYGDTNPTVGTKTKPIQVPRIYVQKDGVAQSTYAYWVRDSGSAIPYLRKHDTHDAEIIEDLASMQLPLHFPNELFFSPETYSALSKSRDRLISDLQLQHLAALPKTPIDLAINHAAVLSNPINESLQQDLTPLLRGEAVGWKDEVLWEDSAINDAAEPAPPSAPRYAALANWVSPLSSNKVAPIRPGQYGNDGMVKSPPLHPVLVRIQFYLQATPYEVPSGPPEPPETEQVPPKIRLHVHPVFALWNPYDVPLEIAKYGIELDCKIDLLITEIYVHDDHYTTLRGYPGMRDEDTEKNKIDPQNIVLLYDNEELLNRNPFRFRLKEVAIGPGECLLFSPTNYEDLNLQAIRDKDWSQVNELTYVPPYRQLNSLQIDTGKQMATNLNPNLWHLLNQHTAAALVYHRWATLTEGNEKVRTSDITMDARLYHLNGNQSDLLQEVNDLIWVENKDLDDNPNKLAPVWNEVFREVNGPSYSLSNEFKIGHTFYLKPSRVDLQNDNEKSAHGTEIAPFAEATPWAARSTRPPGTIKNKDRNESWGGIVKNDSQNAFIPEADANNPNRLRGYTAAVYRMTDLPPGNSNPGNHYLALHQPTAAEDVLSMGLLQHLPLTAKNYYPAYAIGRPSKLDGDYNDLANRAFWDRFYLSGGVSKDGAAHPLVNKTLIPAPGADSVTGANAEKLLKQGALNINSPYPRAWLAVLASRFGLKPADLLDLNLDDSSDSSGSNIQSVPILHTLRASDLAEYPARPVSPSSWRGYRQIIEKDGNNQLRALARQIARLVREEGPFKSMTDFVNSGLLQRAINAQDVSLNTGFDDAMRDTPGYITQADLLQYLAPALHYRSDTFTIRAYGESLDQNGEKIAEALCEATVQRLPDTHPRFPGRRFALTSFFYIDTSELE